MEGNLDTGCDIADNFQVDAIGGLCDIQFNGGDMSGINSAVSIAADAASVTGTWTVPVIAPDCKAKTVTATSAGLYDGGPPGTGSNIVTSSASGSITFECDLNSQCPAGQGCSNGVCQSEDCTNNLDDDNDGYVDCGDSDCNGIITGTPIQCDPSNKNGIISTDGNTYYCSYQQDELTTPAYCCQAGEYWDGTICRESIVCGDPILNIDCYYDIGTPEYYADTTNCFQTNPLPYSSDEILDNLRDYLG